jgi:hypothetical protein
MDGDVLSVLRQGLDDIQRQLKGVSPVVQMVGIPTGIVENILPVLFPSVIFVSNRSSNDCIGIHATLSLVQEKDHCYTKWNLSLDTHRQSTQDPPVDFASLLPPALLWLRQHKAELF